MILTHRWIIGSKTFILVASILFTLHIALTYFSIRKLIDVRKEKNHTAKKLKVIFWFLVVSLNVSQSLSRLFGWSAKHIGTISIRYVLEVLEVISMFLFTTILVNTVSIIQTVLVMAKGNCKAVVDWNRYNLAIISIIPLYCMRLLWAVYIFYTCMNGGTVFFEWANKEAARTLVNNFTKGNMGPIMAQINGAFGLYEFAIRLVIIVILGYLLWEIYKLMKTQRSLKSIRRYKLNEWGFFIIGCIVISLVIVYQKVAYLKSKDKWDKSWWNFIFYDFIGQKIPTNNDETSKIVGLHDMFDTATNIYICGVLTFLAPCRKVKMG